MFTHECVCGLLHCHSVLSLEEHSSVEQQLNEDL